MKKIQLFKLTSRLGPVYGAVGEKGLLVVSIPNKDEDYFLKEVDRRARGVGTQWVEADKTAAGRQLGKYLKGNLSRFRLPLDLSGLSDFTKAVILYLEEIPYGQTQTYGQVAAAVGRPQAARAVGRAVGSNPLPIVLPCHRVIGSDGTLTGFGSGLPTKKALLRLEKQGQSLI